MMNTRIKWILISVLSLLLLIGIVLSTITLTRSGKTKVTIEVMPEDSKVFANDELVSAGENYLVPGTYTFKAVTDGFAEATSSLEVKSEEKFVVLLPEPVSDEANKWFDSPEVSEKREALGGVAALIRGQQVGDENPIIDRLPHVDFAGPFVVDYGFYDADSTKTFIDVNNSTPDGRQAALLWIREQGFDPVDLDLRFSDYINPLVEDDTVGDF